jgi:hypothetical protein
VVLPTEQSRQLAKDIKYKNKFKKVHEIIADCFTLNKRFSYKKANER